MALNIFPLAASLLLFLFANIHASDPGELNLELTLGRGSHTGGSDTGGNQNVNQQVNAGGELAGPSYSSNFNPFVEIQRTRERLTLLTQSESVLIGRRTWQHKWDHSKETEQVCIDIWVRLEVQEMPINESNFKTFPFCYPVKITIPEGSGGHRYRIKNEFVGNPQDHEHYFDLIRCSCCHKFSWDTPLLNSSRDFFIHNLQDRQFIVLVPNGNPQTMLLKMVDFHDLNAAIESGPFDPETKMFKFL